MHIRLYFFYLHLSKNPTKHLLYTIFNLYAQIKENHYYILSLEISLHADLKSCKRQEISDSALPRDLI